MTTSIFQNGVELTGFLLREGTLLRSTVLIWVLIASFSRTGLILLINKIAEAGGATLALFAAVVSVALLMLLTTHQARITGYAMKQRLVTKMRTRLTRQLLDADVGFFQRHSQSEIFHATTGHVDAVAQTENRLAELLQAVLLLIFCLGYMFTVIPVSVFAALLALVFGTCSFLLVEGAARRANRISMAAWVAFNESVTDILRGYRELRLRRSRRSAISDTVASQITLASQKSVETERHFSHGQIGASGALTALLIAIVAVLPLISETDSVTLLQLLTLVLFSFGPIEQMIGTLPSLARASVSFRIVRALEDELAHNAEHPAVWQVDDRAPSFREIALQGVTATLSRAVGEGDAVARDTFTLGPIDLVLRPGQSVFITGGNGMGKSTLLSLLCGLRHPDSGQIVLDGKPVTRENIGTYRANFAAVFSEFYIFRHLLGLSPEERERLGINIEEMGLAEGVSIEGDRFASLALSSGQMRRLALSIALAETRPVIVLDEFAADQDPGRRRFFYDELLPRLVEAGHCVVAVTHDEHCFDKADRLIRMADGRIIADEVRRETAKAV